MEKENILDITYPSEEEMRAAQFLCCGKVCDKCETPAAYAWRKREVDMALLLERAIADELTEREKIIVDNIWYNSLTISETARKLGVSPASIKNTSERALEKLERVLKYVIYYQQDLTNESVVPLVISRARIVSSARKYVPESMCQRIYNLRLSRALSLRALSAASDLSIKRIREIESGCVPTFDELILLSEIFDVSLDYILKGDKNV